MNGPSPGGVLRDRSWDVRREGEHHAARHARLAARLLGAPVAAVVRDARVVGVAACPSEPHDLTAHRPLLEAVDHAIAESGQPVAIEDVDRHEALRQVERPWGTAAALGVPVTCSDDEPFGSLVVLDREGRGWSDEDRAALGELAQAVAETLDLARVRQLGQSLTEHITDLVARESRYRQLAELAFDGILVHVDGRLVYANPAAARTLGVRDPLHLVSRPISDFLPLPFLKSVAERIAGGGEEGLGDPALQRVERADGTSVEVEVIAIPFGIDERPAAQVVIRNVSERMEAQRRLAAREAVLQALLAQVPAALWTTDEALRLTSAKGAQLSLLGHREAPRAGLPLRDLLGTSDEDRAVIAHRDALQGASTTYRQRWRDRCLEVHVEPLHDNGSVQGTLAIALDVTEQQQVMERKAESRKLEALGRLGGGVAHEINNQVTIVLAHAELLLHALPQGPARANAQAIREAGLRTAAVARAALAYSRRQMLRLAPFDANALVARLEPSFRELLGPKVAFEIRPSPGARLIQGDEAQVELALTNLVLNARDAMPEGGRATLSLVPADVPQGPPDGELRPGRYVILRLQDTGSGMDEDTARRAFEPFFTTRPVGQGSGLGLSAAQGIAVQSGGALRFQTRPGQGTRMELWLPQATQEAPAAPPQRAAPQPTTGRVLLVEDEPALREVLARILEAHDFEVHLAQDGQEALEVFARLDPRPGVVVTDLVMPRMNGRELARALAQETPPPQVLFISGFTSDEITRRGLLDPDVPFLQKPFTAQALVDRLQALLGEASQRRG